MKLELSIAADGGLVVRSPQPISAALPVPSSAVTPATPLRDTGSCAPTRAHAIPSSSRYLARSRTGPGISSNVVSASQVASRPVGPTGSLAGRRGLPSSLPVSGIVTFRTKAGSCSLRVFMASPHLWSADLSNQVDGLGGCCQLITEFGMGERDQRLRALGRTKNPQSATRTIANQHKAGPLVGRVRFPDLTRSPTGTRIPGCGLDLGPKIVATRLLPADP